MLNSIKTFALLCVLSVSALIPARATVQWTATTDTNGVFLWPPQVSAGQVSPYSNNFVIIGTNGQPAVTIFQDGSIVTTNYITSNSITLQLTANYFKFYTLNGSLVFSNGELYSLTPGGTTQAAFGSITNIQFAFTAVSNALIALSNNVWAAFIASNSVYQSAFQASNTTLLGALASTNSYTSNILAQIINTNSINLTNFSSGFALQIANNLTNYVFFIATNNGVNITNFVYTIGANTTNAILSTNWSGAHLRFGSFTGSTIITQTNVTFSPPFNDPSYTGIASFQAYEYGGTVGPVSIQDLTPYSYNTFTLNVDTTYAHAGYSYTISYLLYHP